MTESEGKLRNWLNFSICVRKLRASGRKKLKETETATLLSMCQSQMTVRSVINADGRSESFTDTGEKRNSVICRYRVIKLISVSVRRGMNVRTAKGNRQQRREYRGMIPEVRIPGLMRITSCLRWSAVR